MKIVLIGRFNDSGITNGPEKVANRLLSNLSLLCNDVTFITYYFKNSRKSSIFLRLFGSETLLHVPRVMKMGVIRLFFYLTDNQPDIIHFVTEERFQLSIFLYRFLLRAKLCVTVHGILKYEAARQRERYSWFSKLKDTILENSLFTMTDLLVFVSEIQRKFASGYYNIEKRRTGIAANGVDLEFFREIKNHRSRTSIKIVSYTGGIQNYKSVETLKQALSRLKCSCKVELFMLGYASDSTQEINELFKVSYLPLLSREELIEFLSDKDIYININEYESFSIFALECMASGLVPVVSAQVGMSEIIKDGINGFIISEPEPEKICSTIEKIISGKYDINCISRSAMQVRESHNWRITAMNYISLYKDLLNG